MTIPHRTPFLLPLLFPSSLIWRFPTQKPELWLTFDDGPVPGPTDFVLETLAKLAVPATFFCIGDNVRRHPDVYNRILSNGHAIGNHTYNHLNGWSTTDAAYIENVSKCDEYLQGEKTILFRPPYGRIRRSQIRLLSSYRIVMWDVLSRDYDKGLNPQSSLTGTVRAARPGSIVVFHDSLKAEKNLRFVLPRFIEHCLRDGYTFRKMDQHGASTDHTA